MIELRKTPINDGYLMLSMVNQHILRFDISMHDAIAMSIIQSLVEVAVERRPYLQDLIYVESYIVISKSRIQCLVNSRMNDEQYIVAFIINHLINETDNTSVVVLADIQQLYESNASRFENTGTTPGPPAKSVRIRTSLWPSNGNRWAYLCSFFNLMGFRILIEHLEPLRRQMPS